MGQILVFSENDKVGYELLSQGLEIAGSIGAEVAVAVLGAEVKKRGSEYLNRGAAKVYLPDNGANETLQIFEAGVYAEAIAQIAQTIQATVILLGCTRRGKELAGRLAQKLGAGCINDVNRLFVQDNRLVCQRYALGGATVITQQVVSPMAVISVMPGTGTPAAAMMPVGEAVEIALNLKPARVRRIDRQLKTSDATDISEAKTLVCVGMGLAKQEDLALMAELAQLLGGEVACSKPVATDLKWLPEERMVGLSGKKCKPQLAFCLGISGQVQFVVGIREAKTIIAVNNDPNAYIFQISDYGIVGDMQKVVPDLVKLLENKKS